MGKKSKAARKSKNKFSHFLSHIPKDPDWTGADPILIALKEHFYEMDEKEKVQKLFNTELDKILKDEDA